MKKSNKKIMAKRVTSIALGVVIAMTTFGCAKEETATVDYNSLTLDEIIEKAQEEGEVDSVAMPDTWANWIETWEEINSTYGIAHTDLDMSSSEEIAMFKEEGTDATKDIGDVGQQWGPVAEEEGVTLKYKTSYWDDIPDWAKDEDGDWMVTYLGTMSIITNTDLVSNPPKSFADLLEGDYKVTIGDVTVASQAQHAVLAAAYAMGGSIEDIQPGLDFWKTLAEEGRIDKGEASTARIESGEIEVGILWDYNALNYRDNAIANNSNMKFDVCIPSDASVQSGYASIINVNAPHPYAACLAREYILSDEGQINLAKGYATPIRSDVVIPDDVQANRIDQAQYESAIAIEDFDKWKDVCQDIVTYWEENIIPILN